MKSRAVSCSRGPCFVPVLEKEHTLREPQDSRLLRSPDFYQSQKNLRYSSPSQARMQTTVSYLRGEDGDLSSLGSKLLKCNKLHSKMSACLNSSTPLFPVSSEQAH